MTLRTGLAAELTFTVSAADTARALGSGSLEVLATPRLVAWCEAATCAAVAEELDAGSSTVGTRVDLRHLAASAVGTQVRVRAELVESEERRLSFTVRAGDAHGDVAEGEVHRAVVEEERFLAGLEARGRASSTG